MKKYTLIDFQALKLPTTPNYYLSCPATFNCDGAHDSPVFSCSVTALAACWQRLISQQPRITVVASADELRRYRYIQRTRWLRFPDHIDVQLLAMTVKSSSIAIYSRAQYGYSDLGVNRRRVQNWLNKLQVMIDDHI